MALSTEDRKEIVDIITLTVNGKIDRLDRKFTEHQDEMAPIVEGWKTVKNGRNFIVWIGAPLAVMGAMLAFFK